ncbi:MAG TPA: polysaccharide biosynthesis/export family protein [Polyangiaceae bacterium]|jgi:polysaccharide export outer membrane protein
MRFRDLVLLLAVASCGTTGSFVWVQDLPAASEVSGEYLIHTGDIVNVRVVSQDGLATRARVRPDGRIALPLLGEVEVRGKRPSALRSELEARLKPFFVAPSVTVNIDEFAPRQVTVIGEVTHPGVFPIEMRGAGVAQALADAGGFTDYADRSRIFVLRSGERAERIRFTYDAITRGDSAAARFVLQSGDVIVVE